ncbi:MAG TPA: WbqC family protein [Puia sp.]|nr:WbqC family protein [Puia sp.]
MNLVIDIQYFPSIILYKNLYKFSNIIFDQYEAYQKMGFRNRCQIAGAQGVVNLSLPLVKGRGQKTLVRDIRISDRQPWAAQHWKTIVSCYSRAPWFDHYRDDLEGLYRRRFDYLLDWDLACFEWSVRVLGLTIPVRLTEEWVRDYSPPEAVDWRGRLRPKDREVGDEEGEQGGKMGGDGGNPTEGGDPGNRATELVRYRQVFEERTGFIPNLSILDLLFCEGKRAIGYLRG